MVRFPDDPPNTVFGRVDCSGQFSATRGYPSVGGQFRNRLLTGRPSAPFFMPHFQGSGAFFGLPSLLTINRHITNWPGFVSQGENFTKLLPSPSCPLSILRAALLR